MKSEKLCQIAIETSILDIGMLLRALNSLWLELDYLQVRDGNEPAGFNLQKY